MALATADDVETALGRPFTEDVDWLLEVASDLVIGYLHMTPDPGAAPDAVVRVVAEMVAAVLSKPFITAAAYEAGGYNTAREPVTVHVGNESATTSGPWLTKAQKIRLRGAYGMGVDSSVSLSGEAYEPL